MKNYRMANKGRGFEEEVKMSNLQYQRKGLALIQKISTPWVVVRRGKQIVSAFPEGKSTLDFRGTIKPKIPISFDCKETMDKKGLPLINIPEHQIDYMKKAMEVEEITFILCYMKTIDKRLFIPGETVIKYWNRWERNKGSKGYNFIPLEEMEEIKSRNGIVLDYIGAVKENYKDLGI